jgi:myo-inositol-1(or 4)-monophosphatase
MNCREIGCWPWDVCAGIVIAQEAGGLVTGSHEVFESSKLSESFGEVTEEILTGRKYVVIRGIAPNEVRVSRILLSCVLK